MAIKPFGRPPKHFSEEKCHSLGEDLLKWLDDPQGGKNQIFYVRWYYHKHGMSRTEWRDLTQRQSFRTYYEIARKIITDNLLRNKEIAQSYGGRYLAIHDDELREGETQIAKELAEAEAKVQDAKNLISFAENLGKIDVFFQQLRSMQTSENTLSLVNHKA